ncbi:MAG TPA: hypothetical protein PKD09_20950 [Aggregatilinea sp.]|uniref:hypothetical protein n=1 Tax=Aggregatilinea sp. TaxID=2806333 RepID=UPI002C141D72|nr:hypothetical protein [Aggregatilinea sp.]HML24135.1 hypothetical protein [Aggregatilinea sp.]
MSHLLRLPARRPWSLWTFGLIVAALGLYNLALALDHVRRADDYRALAVSYPPLLRAALALVWAVLLLAFAAGLIRCRPWARRWSLILLSNYGAFGVLWMVVYARTDFARGRIGFQAAVTVLLLVLAGVVLRGRQFRATFRPSPSDEPEPMFGEGSL